jgi:hypothetical protein
MAFNFVADMNDQHEIMLTIIFDAQKISQCFCPILFEQ